jgi:hypothetical protein
MGVWRRRRIPLTRHGCPKSLSCLSESECGAVNGEGARRRDGVGEHRRECTARRIHRLFRGSSKRSSVPEPCASHWSQLSAVVFCHGLLCHTPLGCIQVPRGWSAARKLVWSARAVWFKCGSQNLRRQRVLTRIALLPKTDSLPAFHLTSDYPVLYYPSGKFTRCSVCRYEVLNPSSPGS